MAPHFIKIDFLASILAHQTLNSYYKQLNEIYNSLSIFGFKYYLINCLSIKLMHQIKEIQQEQ